MTLKSFDKIRIAAVAFGLVGAWLMGYQSSAEKFELKAAKMAAEYENRAHLLEVEYREKERFESDARILAWQERDRAFKRLHDSDAKYQRMRDEFAAYRAKVSRIVSASGNSHGEPGSGDIDLLERSASLLGKCEKLLRAESADKEALVTIYEAARTVRQN